MFNVLVSKNFANKGALSASFENISDARVGVRLMQIPLLFLGYKLEDSWQKSEDRDLFIYRRNGEFVLISIEEEG